MEGGGGKEGGRVGGREGWMEGGGGREEERGRERLSLVVHGYSNLYQPIGSPDGFQQSKPLSS